ncbi:M24 family metallopeptidase [Microbaculum sp. FT89]|uniref:M24 family metallopeptidase n=1 Tax=Microbaculum sp. FT89 TaxID=3447298 RepID=UPI003F536A6B
MLLMDSETLRARVADVEASVTEQGFDALVVFATGSALGSGSKSHGNMRYLADWDGHNTPAMILFVPGHAPMLLTPNIFLKFLGQEKLWFDDIRFARPGDFGKAVVEALETRLGRPARRLATLGFDDMPLVIWSGLDRALPGMEWTGFQDEMDRRRVVKDQLQLAFHRRAADICDAIFAEMPKLVRQGLRGYQIQAHMEMVARLAGAEYIQTWLTIGPVADYSRFWREECMRVPQSGDQVIAGIYMIYDGHWGHAIRSGTVGPANDAQRRVYDVAAEMMSEGLAKLRPGGNLYDVNRAFETVLERHFPNPHENGVFTFRAAHGLGYSYEDSVVSAPFPQAYDPASKPAPEDAFLEIRDGMLFEFHPNLFVPDLAGAALGDMVAVRGDAPEVMTVYPRNLHEW